MPQRSGLPRSGLQRRGPRRRALRRRAGSSHGPFGPVKLGRVAATARAAASRSSGGRSRADTRSMPTPLAAATCPRSASRPSLMSIMAVAPSRAASGPRRRGAPGAGARRPAGRRPGARGAAGPGRRRRGRAGRPPPPGRPGRAPEREHRGRPARSPRPVTASRTRIGAGPCRRRRRSRRPGRIRRPAPRPGPRAQSTGRSPGAASATSSAGGRCAHGRDVGQALRGGLDPDVGRARPVPAEMPALEQEIGAGHHPAVGRGQDRRVVADPDQGPRRSGGQPRNRRDQAELAQRGHGPRRPAAMMSSAIGA